MAPTTRRARWLPRQLPGAAIATRRLAAVERSRAVILLPGDWLCPRAVNDPNSPALPYIRRRVPFVCLLLTTSKLPTDRHL